MKNWLLEKIYTIAKPLANLTKRYIERIHIEKIIDEKEALQLILRKLKRIIITNFKIMYPTKLENLRQMDEFIYNILPN